MSGSAPRPLNETAGLWYLALNVLVPGVWALVSPQGFYQNFPLPGHAWVAAEGPYNEHLLRDFGSLQLSLAALTLLSLFWPRQVNTRVVAICTLVYGLPHLIYHLMHLQAFSGPLDMVAAVLLLALQVMVPILLLVHAPPEPGRTP
ncbi:hypothetical protein [Deinococcus roseus]|uniref:DUF4345 domain-containing protein n=1 Tax=Deinococcus roseus TaxID=392414 RepID=A0ABQ2D174_9DEIO|nr:hypothetical protein [Deinococcus roseus]GGJ41215.1 hypothetical protein GCM10008938_29020 [Deinococcus roseus]